MYSNTNLDNLIYFVRTYCIGIFRSFFIQSPGDFKSYIGMFSLIVVPDWNHFQSCFCRKTKLLFSEIPSKYHTWYIRVRLRKKFCLAFHQICTLTSRSQNIFNILLYYAWGKWYFRSKICQFGPIQASCTKLKKSEWIRTEDRHRIT